MHNWWISDESDKKSTEEDAVYKKDAVLWSGKSAFMCCFNVFSIFSGGFTGDVLFCNKSYTYDNIPCIFFAGNKNIPWSTGNTSESLRV